MARSAGGGGDSDDGGQRQWEGDRRGGGGMMATTGASHYESNSPSRDSGRGEGRWSLVASSTTVNGGVCDGVGSVGSGGRGGRGRERDLRN
jgi:hypothetical protein